MSPRRSVRCRWSSSATLLTLFGLTLTGAAAPPATKPADPKPPDAKADHNTTEYIAADLHAHFRVPKTWQRKDVQGPHADAIFLFDPAPPSKKPARFLQMIQVAFDLPKESQKTLADVTADLRDALRKQSPGLKFTKDSAIKFAGQPAWQLQWTEQTKATLTPAAGGKAEQSTMETDRAVFVWLADGNLCTISLYADSGFIPSLTQKAEGVGKTVTWEK